MRTVPKWVNKIHEADKIEFSSVHTICFSPDGTQLVVGAGEKVMVYDPRDGALVQLLQAHKGPVHAVAYCGDGKKFASGSADKNVIIWTSKMEGVLKYSHSEAIQCLAYNPVTFHLASCAISDFAFWSVDVKAVQKIRVSGRITSCAWDQNGQHLAIGLANGVISIRNKMGEEVQRLVRDAAVWAVAFTKTCLLVTDWDETLSFYDLQGQSVYKDRHIGICALSISLLGTLVVIGGVGGWVVLTAEGVPIINTPQDWVWAVAPLSLINTLAVACQDGTLWCYQIVFSTVHGLYRDLYAYRENMTDVIIQHLTNGNKVRIKCHDRVHKIAIYKHRLAVQLPERVVVYEQGDVEGMLYRVKEKLPQKIDCSLLVATSDSLVVCVENKLSLVGKQISKSWVMPAPVRYVKVTTLYFEEVLLLGLLNGQIWQVEPCDGSSKLLVESPGIVRCLDVSASRGCVAVVDDASVCRVYSLPTGDILYTEENVSSVSFNSWCDELLSLSGNGLLSIKAGLFPPATQPLAGAVVGFQGGRVFCLQANAMQTINVPLSHAVHQYLQQKSFNEAYAVACLGVTPLDWERLGVAALEELSFEVARKAFQRSENIVYLTLIDHLQERFEAGEKRAVIIGEVLAYRGRYTEAARSFHSVGRDEKALNLYVDLRMFNKAQEYVAEGEGVTALARRRADWARHVNDPRAAAEMYLAAGDVMRAARLMAETGKRDMLIELARKLDKGSSESLRHVAEALVAVGEPVTAADVYHRLGDYSKVAQLAVTAGEWSRAFALAREHAECKREVYLLYAHRMAQENKFVESQKAYHMAGETATAMRVFAILVNNAITEERFSDAGYLYHLLAMQLLDTASESSNGIKLSVKEHRDHSTVVGYFVVPDWLATTLKLYSQAPSGDPTALESQFPSRLCVLSNTSSQKDQGTMEQYIHNDRLSQIYHAYESVHRCVHEPFSLSQSDALLNAARYILALIEGHPPPGVSLFCLYLCIAKQAKVLNAHTLARQMLDKILALQIPLKFQESVELLILKTRACDGGDSQEDDVAPLCWRCRRHAPPLCGAKCPHCRHTMAHSLATHEVLPLVQFEPAEGISYEEALDLIERMPLPEAMNKEDTEGAEVLKISHDIDSSDPFLDKYEEDDSAVVVCSRGALLHLNPASVLIVKQPQLRTRMYRNMLPELAATCCPHCYKLFYMEDYEIQLVTKGHCPFCRHPAEEARNDEDDVDSTTSTPDTPTNAHGSWR